ncbi:MAG: redox-sensing transcriptional repressor Rex [Deltaproteobacteria bacterium]|nr:redox-sensing transcriptional repressor Rex [Deltaproteobacteria bacterium]
MFGSFGRRGVGYKVRTLRENIGRILGLNREWNVAVIGAGQLSNVLMHSEIFREKNLLIKKIFDNTPEMISKRIRGIEVSDMANLEKELNPEEIHLAVIVLPPVEVQSMIDRRSKMGIKGALYFASRTVNVRGRMVVRKRDISIDLGGLTYDIAKNT